MASFKVQVPNLQRVGPVTELVLTQSIQYLKSTSNQQKPIKVLAMIDTGATTTVIKTGLAHALGISPIGDCSINTPSSINHRCLQYDIQLIFPNNVAVSSCIVTEAPLQNQHIQCLIGRDILQNSILIYTGFDNTFTLSF